MEYAAKFHSMEIKRTERKSEEKKPILSMLIWTQPKHSHTHTHTDTGTSFMSANETIHSLRILMLLTTFHQR